MRISMLFIMPFLLFQHDSLLASQFTIRGDLIPSFQNIPDSSVFPGPFSSDPSLANGNSGASNDGGFDAFDNYGFYENSVHGFTNNFVHRRQAIAQQGNIYQWLDTFMNNTESTLTQTVTFRGNLGSDSSTRVESFETNYMVTSDGVRGDPVIAHVLGNNSFVTSNMTRRLNGDNYFVDIDLSLAPGESTGLLMYAFLARELDGSRDGDIGLASTTAMSLVANPIGAGLTAEQIASIINFDNVSAIAAMPVVPQVNPIPLPASLWLFGSAIGWLGLRRRYQIESFKS